MDNARSLDQSVMSKGKYEIFEAVNPFLEVVLKGLRGFVDGRHYSTGFYDGGLPTSEDKQIFVAAGHHLELTRHLTSHIMHP